MFSWLNGGRNKESFTTVIVKKLLLTNLAGKCQKYEKDNTVVFGCSCLSQCINNLKYHTVFMLIWPIINKYAECSNCIVTQVPAYAQVGKFQKRLSHTESLA